MKIEKLMSTGLVCVDLDESLLSVKEIFEHFEFHHVLVTENEILIGVISDRDLLAALSPAIGTAAETSRDLALLQKRVHQICTRNPITVTSKQSVASAIEIFNDENVSCVPVVDENNKPIGILTLRDIVKFLASVYKNK